MKKTYKAKISIKIEKTHSQMIIKIIIIKFFLNKKQISQIKLQTLKGS
jgi:hypothetical protein